MDEMTDQMSLQGIPHGKDTSNFQYAGMYLTLIATILFLFVFLITLGLAWEAVDVAGEWLWEVVWVVVLYLIILIGGFVSVVLTYKRRGYPTVITVMTLMLAASILSIFELYGWPTLTMMTFVVCLIALIKLSIGHGEFITPRQKREGKAIGTREKTDRQQTQSGYSEKIYEQERPPVARQQPARTRKKEQPAREAKQASGRTQQPARGVNVKKAAQTRQATQTTTQSSARPRAQQPNMGTKSLKVRNCGKCAEMIPRDEPVCWICGDDSYKKELIRKVEIAYESGVITKEQYLNNLKKFGI